MKKKQSLKESAVSLAIALAVVFSIRSSIVESFKIPSGSMIPTLVIGDYIFVNKFAYGLRLPFTDVFVTEKTRPGRGDIIVFRFPKDESIDFIKRVVGLPGETIEVRDKVLYVNGEPMPQTQLPKDRADKKIADGDLDDPKYRFVQPAFFRERLGAVEHTMLIDRGNPMLPSFGPITVPADSFFVMGDNRDVSNDSRFWGFVPRANIKGRAFVIWMTTWVDFGEKFYRFRVDRVGRGLE